MALTKQKLEYSLYDESMGILERAGLAGLYLTLQGADEWATKDKETETGVKARKLKALFEPWDLSFPDRLHLIWRSADDLTPLKTLVEWAWQVRDGVFFLPAIHRTLAERNNYHQRLLTHNGILATFLQHGKVQPRQQETQLEITIDEGKIISRKCKFIQPRKHGIKPLKDITSLFSRGKLRKNIDTVSLKWVHPGTAPRFGSKDPSAQWQGPATLAYLLFFCPIACSYLKLTSEKLSDQTKPNNWLITISSIHNLRNFSEIRRSLEQSGSLQKRFEEIDVTSPADGALRYAVAYTGRSWERSTKRQLYLEDKFTIYVVAMGKTSYYDKTQSVRKRILDLTPSEVTVHRYSFLMAYFPNYWAPTDTKTQKEAGLLTNGRILTPAGRGRIANNLAEGNPWYMDVTIPIEWEQDGLEKDREYYNNTHKNDKKSDQEFWFIKLKEKLVKEALMALARERSMYDDPDTEMVFLHAVHDMMATLFWKERTALGKKLGLNENDPEFDKKLGNLINRYPKNKQKLNKRNDDLVDDFRRSLTESQTHELFRQAITNWLSKGGAHENIRSQSSRIWNLINHPRNWKKARDLALLGTVTYEGRAHAQNSNGGAK
jgi:CRISPR-associated protein Cas8a1/Csx13